MFSESHQWNQIAFLGKSFKYNFSVFTTYRTIQIIYFIFSEFW